MFLSGSTSSVLSSLLRVLTLSHPRHFFFFFFDSDTLNSQCQAGKETEREREKLAGRSSSETENLSSLLSRAAGRPALSPGPSPRDALGRNVGHPQDREGLDATSATPGSRVK